MKNGGILRPLFLWISRRHHKRATERVDFLGRRLGMLQLGSSIFMFERVLGLEKMVEGGLGARKLLSTLRGVIAADGPIAFSKVWGSLDEIEAFVDNAFTVLDAYDAGFEEGDRFFVVRPEVRSLF